jgi:hypothetical protein
MTKEQAITISAKYAEQQGWPWLQPIECKRAFPWCFKADYLIRSLADHRGQNVVMTIDAVDGTIKNARFVSR